MTMIIDGSAGVTFPNSTVQASAGVVLQVVNATTNTSVSNSTNTEADTTLTATITPKFATSKILVIVDQNGIYKDTSNTYMGLKLYRNATPILLFENYAGVTSTTSVNGVGGGGCAYLDSPATTSAVTYKTTVYSGGNVARVIIQVNNEYSTITLMEIAG